ncbi:hypothetical protein [Nostoc sp. ChiVER01]|uniref:hypothetical protein n=1 Tax=Nostoc sp. ChiVER01 TaxID=3075382 RepID=UPI002AD56D9B|nr:hypothetical protein [Nostoc sp. ChiVER01]MDZ8222267.1 hypothetical protein [Nostoc sp. ChiVER01]MDZ8222269.1 hypothetical protein [Nostoc sp. ChiVER01]
MSLSDLPWIIERLPRSHELKYVVYYLGVDIMKEAFGEGFLFTQLTSEESANFSGGRNIARRIVANVRREAAKLRKQVVTVNLSKSASVSKTLNIGSIKGVGSIGGISGQSSNNTNDDQNGNIGLAE